MVSQTIGEVIYVKSKDIADEILANVAALAYEVNALAQRFDEEPKFYGDNRNFPHAHYGYLMACMGQIDVMSKCEFGPGEPHGGQTPRMREFMLRYLHPNKADEHRVAIKLMRHTLMHTGALRPLYDKDAQVAYTWRLHFGDTLPSGFTHYTLTVEDSAHQQELLAAVPGPVVKVRALNIRLTAFAADVVRAALDYRRHWGRIRRCVTSVRPSTLKFVLARSSFEHNWSVCASC